jgi:hypothetical protein
MAMGAILGIAAYGRTQEKLNGANNGGITLPTNSTPTAPLNGNFSQPVATTASGKAIVPIGNQPEL